MRHGAVFISLTGERYYLYCANPVNADVAEKLREKLEHLRSLTIEQIKLEYKETLRADTPADSKGAGLGFLTMARDASAPLEFEFSPPNARMAHQIVLSASDYLTTRHGSTAWSV